MSVAADLLLTGISQLVTPPSAGPRNGRFMRELTVIEDAALAIHDGQVAWMGRRADWAGTARATHDLGHRAVVPGLVDPHTHAVWAGDRLADFDARTSGRTYEEILRAGGGIRSTVRATAAASQAELVALALPRLRALIASGATSIEVKSGYGFTPEAELRSLVAVAALAKLVPARLHATLLIHIPPAESAERPAYAAAVCEQLIPEAAGRRLATAVDVFVEAEAWHPSEARAILLAARAHGLATKLHTEQFHRVGGLELGLELGCLSLDHLEAAEASQLALFAGKPTLATILPGVTLHLGLPAAPGRGLIDAGAAVAIGTDLNPGSSPLFSVATALALAVRLNGLTAAEALTAGTVNAAAALGSASAGRIAPGLPADFLVLDSLDWRDLVYTFGAHPVREVWIGGSRIPGTPQEDAS